MRLLALLALATALYGQDGDEPAWRILRYEAFEPEPLVAGGDAEALIDKLVELEEPRDGIRNDCAGGPYFTPTGDAFGRLVRLGPAALPALLEHLDDKRATKLVFPDHGEGIGGVFQYLQLIVPPTCPDERKLIRDAFGKGIATDDYAEFDIDKKLEGHTVTVGDCCFAIVGQIVNRPYEAVRYQPSLITAVCSPTLEPRLAKALRAAWGHRDARRLLAKSLQDDFHSRGHGSWVSWLQAGAAARLCAYFPEQAGPLVARRIAELTFDPERDGIEAGQLLWLVLKTDCPAARTAWLPFLDPARPKAVQLAAIEAISREPDPEVLQRVRNVFEHTNDPDLVLACLRWLPLEGDGLFDRLRRALGRTFAMGRRGNARSQDVLEVMIRLDKKRSLDLCRNLLKVDARKLVVTGAIYQVRDRDLALALLPPLLRDTARLDLHSTPSSFGSHDRRVCDYVAAALARAVEELAFSNANEVGTRDREIAAMKVALAKR